MTRDQDIERVLDHWFIEGPTQMPGRFLDDTLDRIDRAPRQRLARLRTRLPIMHPDLRHAAAAAIVLAVVGLGAAVLTQTGGVGRPSSAGSGLLPASGEVRWLPVGTRQHPLVGGGTGDFDLDIVIGPTTITVSEWHGDVRNAASLVGADRLDLRMLTNPVVQRSGQPRAVWPCQVGDAGIYTYRLSSDGKRLTLTAVNDACAVRATILVGDWDRSELGDLTSGFHVSDAFRPFGGGTSGGLAYNVPPGWALQSEGPEALSLRPRGASEGLTISVFSNVVPISNSPDAGCAASPADVQGTPAAIAAWLATRVIVTAPAPITIGGMDGVMVDASVNPSLRTCPDLFFDFARPAGAALSGEHRARYILLDRGDGQVMLISIDAPDKAAWDAKYAVGNAMSIIYSFEFTR